MADMNRLIQQRSEERAARARQLRPGWITVYRELLARQRAGALSTRDAIALDGLRASLLISGGIPTDEESPPAPTTEELEERG